MNPAGGTKFRRELTPHLQELFGEGGSKLGGLSLRVLSPDQARVQPQHTPSMSDGVGLMDAYLAQRDSSVWLDQVPVII